MKTSTTFATVMSMAALTFVLPFAAMAEPAQTPEMAPAMAAAPQSSAEEIDDAWNNNKWVSVGYVSDKLTGPDFSVKGKWGLALQTGKTYWVTKPIASVLRLGVDAIWCDANYVNFNRFSMHQDLDWPGGDYDDGLDLGHHRLDIGLGVGVQAAYMPFINSSSSVRNLRFSAYFRFTPSYSALIQSYDGDSEFSHGFTPFFNCGATVQYRALSIGVEGRWGTAKFKDTINDIDEKTKCKSSSVRVFLGFNF